MESSRGDSKADSKPEANQNGLIPIEAIARQEKWSERITQEILAATPMEKDAVGIVVSFCSPYDLGKWTYNISFPDLNEVQQVVDKKRTDIFTCTGLVPDVISLIKNYCGGFYWVDDVYQSYGLKDYSEEKDDEALKKIKENKDNVNDDVLFGAAVSGHIKTLTHLAEMKYDFTKTVVHYSQRMLIDTNLLIRTIEAQQHSIAVWLLGRFSSWDVNMFFEVNNQNRNWMYTRYEYNPLTLCINVDNRALAYCLLSHKADPVYMRDNIVGLAKKNENVKMLSLFSFFSVKVQDELKNDFLSQCKSDLKRIFEAYITPKDFKERWNMKHQKRAIAVRDALLKAGSLKVMQMMIRAQKNVLEGRVIDPEDMKKLPIDFPQTRWWDAKQVKNKFKKTDTFYQVIVSVELCVNQLIETPAPVVEWWK